MTGPNGLTFKGVVTSGGSEFVFNSWSVGVNYSGQWSNGDYASGFAQVSIGNGGTEGFAELTQQNAPEPASFVLLGSGLLGTLGIRRKFILYDAPRKLTCEVPPPKLVCASSYQ